MFTLTTFVFASFLNATAYTQNCTNQDAFKNVRVVKYILNNTKSEVQAANSDDLRDALLSIAIATAFTHNCTNPNAFNNAKALVTFYNNMRSEVQAEGSGDILIYAHEIELLHPDMQELCESAIPDVFKSLNKLVLKGNGITAIYPAAFKNLPVLRDLTIAYNDIKTIKTGVFNYLNVAFLNLQSNGINLIEANAFDNMPELQVLQLDYNHIKEIGPHWFSGSPKVRRLTMEENLLHDLPKGAFQNMASNNVDILIMNNQITKIHPKAFQGIQKANLLWFHDNKVAELDDELFANVEKIERLSFAGNQLKCVSDKFLENLKKSRVKSIDFNGNPLDSDCNTKLKTWKWQNIIKSRLFVKKLYTSQEARRLLQYTIG